MGAHTKWYLCSNGMCNVYVYDFYFTCVPDTTILLILDWRDYYLASSTGTQNCHHLCKEATSARVQFEGLEGPKINFVYLPCSYGC